MIKTTALTLLLICLIFFTTNMGSANDSGKIVIMPINAIGDISNENIAVIEEIIYDHFRENRLVELISNEQMESLTGETTGSRLQIIKTVTAKTKSGKALIFSLLRYNERVGDRYSVKDPASLAFEFKLINSDDGKVTCSGSYDETQQSLTENIFNFPRAFKRGFKWLTVKEIANEAVREKLDECPALVSDS